MANKALELNIDFNSDSKSENEGSFSLQPLERGYGTTIGNALRRVLLQVFQERDYSCEN